MKMVLVCHPVACNVHTKFDQIHRTDTVICLHFARRAQRTYSKKIPYLSTVCFKKDLAEIYERLLVIMTFFEFRDTGLVIESLSK
jgi:hypothetical protein